MRAELSSRAVASQVLSPRTSLTSVFGMGTGVPSPPLTRTIAVLSQLFHFSTSSVLCQDLFLMVTRGRIELPFAA